MLPLLAAIAGPIVDVLKGTGIIKDPEMEIKAREVITKQLEGQQQFFLDYFTATVSKDEPWYSPSKLFRPLCSFAIVTFYVIARFKGIVFTGVDEAVLFGVVGFWFGGRTIEKLLDKN